MHHSHRRIITYITLVTLLCAGFVLNFNHATSHTAHAQQATPHDPQPAFDAALVRLNEGAQFGEAYAFNDVRVDGAWAIAIAQPVAGSGIGGITPHTLVPMIGLLESKSWLVVLPSPANAAEFNALLNNVPVTLMDEQTKAFLQQPVVATIGISRADAPTGHKLPAPYNQPIAVTTRDGSTHLNQVDFVTRAPYVGEIVASKPGKVVFVKQSSNAGKCDFAIWQQANLVVVQHGPSEYSWYFHLAQNSVPVRVGDSVNYGTRIGLQGTTGYACGAHLHYMVSTGHTTWTDPNNPNAAPWATGIVPVDFLESPWLDLKVGNSYVSQNRRDDACAAPAQQQPSDGVVANDNTLAFAWVGLSSCTFNGYTLRIKDTPNMDAGGTTILDTTINGLNATAMIPAAWNYRDVYWGVRAANATDAAWGVRKLRIEPTISGSYSLYGNTNFIGTLFTSNQIISDLNTIKLDNWPRSMKLDAGVGVLVCRDTNFKGTCARATGPREIGNLNTLALGLTGNVSSIRACAGACPSGPVLPKLTYPISGQVVYSGTVVAAQWQGDVAASSYQAELSGGALTQTLSVTVTAAPTSGVSTLPITPMSSMHTMDLPDDLMSLFGALPASTQPYALRIQASNDFGESDWAETTFVVAPTVPITSIAPLTPTVGISRSVFLPVVVRPRR